MIDSNKNHTIVRWGMPNYYTRNINNCEVSVRPKGFREHGLLRKWPLRGGWQNFALSIKNNTEQEKDFQYIWFLKRKINGGDTEVDNQKPQKKLKVMPKNGATQDISSFRPLVFPGQHTLHIQAYGKEEILAHFDIPEADKTLRPMGDKLIVIVIAAAVGAAVGAIVTVAIQKLLEGA